MRSHFPERCCVIVVCGLVAAAGMSLGVSAQTGGKPERYNASAVNLNSGPGTGRVLIAIDRWTTATERERLLRVVKEKGADKLLDALIDSPSAGTIRFPNTLAWDLRYAFESPSTDGGRRVVLVTDRPISAREAANDPRVSDYPFTLIEIRFDKSGVGVGKMSMATKIAMSRDKQTMELENYAMEPVRLTEVRIEK